MENQNEGALETNHITRPTVSFASSDGIRLAVWKRKNDKGIDDYSVRIDGVYKDRPDNFKSSAYLRDQDLLRVEKLLGKVDAWIEQDRGIQRRNFEGRSK